MLPQYMTKELYKKFSCCFNKSLESPAFPSSPYKKEATKNMTRKNSPTLPDIKTSRYLLLDGLVVLYPNIVFTLKNIISSQNLMKI